MCTHAAFHKVALQDICGNNYIRINTKTDLTKYCKNKSMIGQPRLAVAEVGFFKLSIFRVSLIINNLPSLLVTCKC